jgi:hypothetical protein
VTARFEAESTQVTRMLGAATNKPSRAGCALGVAFEQSKYR